MCQETAYLLSRRIEFGKLCYNERREEKRGNKINKRRFRYA